MVAPRPAMRAAAPLQRQARPSWWVSECAIRLSGCLDTHASRQLRRSGLAVRDPSRCWPSRTSTQAPGRLQTVEHTVCCSSSTAELHGPGVGDPPSTDCAAAAAAPGGHISPRPPSSDVFQQHPPARPAPTLCGTGRAGPVSPVARSVSSVPKSSEGPRIREVTCRRAADQGFECQIF